MTPEETIDLTDFKFVCPVCDQHLACVDSQRGRQIRCPGCQEDITIPPPLRLTGHSGAGRTPRMPLRSLKLPPAADPTTSEKKGLPSEADADQWYQ